MSKKTIYIVRHGQTDFNKQGIVQGSGVNSSLNARGQEQASAFYQKYKHEPFEAVLTSRLLRTHETMAGFINDGIPWEQFDELNEISWGQHEGRKSTPAMQTEFQELLKAWSTGQYHARIAGGESALEMHERLSTFVEYLKNRPEEKILVCSHGRAMRCLMTVLENAPISNMQAYEHDNTGLYLVNYTPHVFQFELENDLSHLN